VAAHGSSAGAPVVNADPENEWPFTRRADASASATTPNGGGFSWTDGAIGLCGLRRVQDRELEVPFNREGR
jgi:hypothetical protein